MADNVNRLREIEALGQAIWIDNIYRQLIDDGELERLIEQDGVTGVTSNPTIFEKAMGDSDRYDDAFREGARETDDPQEIFERLAYADIRDAADLLRPSSRRRRAGRLRLLRAAARRSPTTPRARSRRRSATVTRSTGPTC